MTLVTRPPDAPRHPRMTGETEWCHARYVLRSTKNPDGAEAFPAWGIPGHDTVCWGLVLKSVQRFDQRVTDSATAADFRHMSTPR